MTLKTLNGAIALILRYFTKFVYNVVVKKFTFAISSPDELLINECAFVFHQFQIVHKYYLSFIITLAISLYSVLSNTCSLSLTIIKLTLVGITLWFRLLYAILFCLYALFCE